MEGFELFPLFEFDPNKKFEILRHVITPHLNVCPSAINHVSGNILSVQRAFLVCKLKINRSICKKVKQYSFLKLQT